MEDVQRIGAELADARTRRGWTLTDLAARSGVTRQSIAKIEDGHPRGEIGVVAQLADTLGLELAVQTRKSDRMSVMSRLRARTEKDSREAVLARGIYGSGSPEQLSDDVLAHRAAHLVTHWRRARRDSIYGWRLTGCQIPNPLRRALDERDPGSGDVLEFCRYEIPFLYLRLAVEHPGWLLEAPSGGIDESRRDLSWLVTKYANLAAPDHRGRLVSFTKRLPSRPDETWITKSDRALAALKPAVAQGVANVLSRELWGRWIVQDFRLYAFPHEHHASETEYFLTQAAGGGRGRYRGDPAFDAATYWPEAETELITDKQLELNVRRRLNRLIGSLADSTYGAKWDDDMYTLTRSLDIISMSAVAEILAAEVEPLSIDDEYQRSLAALTSDGGTEREAIRAAVVDAARRGRLQIVPS